MKKSNCWEVKGCGRELGGIHEKEFGHCPAVLETRLDGIHGGNNAGRSCWVVSGTFCQGEVQGTFAKKFKQCEACDFYARVRKEEAHQFTFSAELYNLIRQK